MSDQDLEFRAIVMLLFIGVRFVRWHARRLIGWKTSWPAMEQNRLDTALLMILLVAWVAAVVVYVAGPQLVARFSVPLPAWIRWSAVAAAVAGLALLWRADRCLGENLSVTLRIRDNHTLVTSGPYRRVRHPIYTATLIYAAAMGLITANYLLAALFVVPMVVLVMLRVGREEAMMIGAFGAEYRAYMSRTGRLIPKWRQRSQP
jgi:protein-S-isoprenylcysteine O-methyltransferase Ste14